MKFFVSHAWGKSLFRSVVVATGLLFLLTPLQRRARASEGDLDTGFGSGGKVSTQVSPAGSSSRALTIQRDGRILQVGSIVPFDFAVVRYHPDGKPDAEFGSGGVVTTDFFGAGDQAYDIAVQADGRIVAAGLAAKYAGSEPDFALARYNPDGSLDSTFGAGGKVTTDFRGQGYYDSCTSIAIQADGKIVAAGLSYPVGTDFDFALVRYNPDGTLDTSFGNGGKVTTDFLRRYDAISKLVIQRDGKIVAAGTASEDNGLPHFGLARYNPDGSLDTGFGEEGKVMTYFFGGANRSADQALALALQRDGRLVVSGAASDLQREDGPSEYDLALARYNIDGSLDTSFGVGGKVTTDFNNSEHGRALDFQPDGKIIVSGSSHVDSTGYNFLLARYDTDGSLDETFGDGGKVMTDFFGGADHGWDLVLQKDGKAVVGGSVQTSAGTQFGLARYKAYTVNYDICFSDDGGSAMLSLNSITGDYQFTPCGGGTVITGTGTVARRGCVLTLRHNAPDRRVVVKVDACRNTGTVTVQGFSPGETFTITDMNKPANTCACP